jgi:hypothetical protein
MHCFRGFGYLCREISPEMKEDREHELKARVLLVAEPTDNPQMLALIVALRQYVRLRMPPGGH